MIVVLDLTVSCGKIRRRFALETVMEGVPRAGDMVYPPGLEDDHFHVGGIDWCVRGDVFLPFVYPDDDLQFECVEAMNALCEGLIRNDWHETVSEKNA